MDRIRLYNTSNGWMAKHSGPHAAEVEELFGSTTLPTAFTCTAAQEYVVAEVSRLNPGYEVT